jgi:two-component system chemotaxis sensor kinase CheA
MDLSKYRQLFLDECREHLQVMNRELLRLEQEAGTGVDVEGLFRAAHSIKGMSGSMGFDAVVAVSHALEDVLDRLRKKTLAVGPGLMALLYEGVDALGALVAEIGDKGATRLEIAGLAARLRGAAGGEAPPRPAAEDTGPGLVTVRGGIFDLDQERLAAVGDLVRSGLVPYACHVRLDKDSAALGARNFIVLGRLGKAGRVLASSPTVDEIRAGAGRELIEALVLTERSEDQLRAQLLAIPELRELRLRRLSLGGGETAPTLLASRTATVERPRGAAPGVADRYARRKISTVRVETGVLDELINIVGELLITRERLEEIGRELESRELHASLERLRVLVRGFQDTIMKVRMMPLELVTDRLPRIVRDLAHHSGKQVSFEVAGRGVELDRAILEELNDVLIHLVRNAIDHGVETPEQRAAAGKPSKAAVRVCTGRERDWVWIRVEDDGRGMDPGLIAGAAVARGLVSAERAAAL